MIIRIKDAVKVLLGMANAIPAPEIFIENKSDYLCPTCNNKVAKFFPLPDVFFKELNDNGFIHPLFLAETLNIFHYSCPVCGASDRDRLYSLYFRTHAPLENTGQFRILDIAPTKPLQNFIKSAYPAIRYRSADFLMENVDDKVDLRNMDIYDDNNFDFIICSHVLEHIDDDTKAISELYRVLKQGCKSIIMVPILLNLTKDYENPEITDPGERWKHFGQNDHVRLYSKRGFIGKLMSAGFSVTEYNIGNFGPESFASAGIHPRSVLYVVKK